ncbi:MAG TPA: hypothetical protein EYG81_00575 [Archaeoglobus profundus]|nr:hypothetical protein [Archaeoglobus profundus]
MRWLRVARTISPHKMHGQPLFNCFFNYFKIAITILGSCFLIKSAKFFLADFISSFVATSILLPGSSNRLYRKTSFTSKKL